MIVIGVDVHKHSLAAVAVDEAGRMLDEKTVAAADGELVAWASGLSGERLWALEDCRQLTRSGPHVASSVVVRREIVLLAWRGRPPRADGPPSQVELSE